MTAPAVVITVPEPHAHQQRIVASRKRFKAVRAGRRYGKTVIGDYCGVMGHGPLDRAGTPLYKGLADGMDVAWIARDYTQSGIIWAEIIRPRYKNVDGVRLNENERTVTLPTGGTLWVRSSENIDSIRGIGAKLAGVVVEEAAWLDLEYALQKVIVPALTDNEGWLLLISTTNAGDDGNQAKRRPSYFNVICQEIRDGKRPEWDEFYGTAEDNPRISASAFAAMVVEYPEGSLALEEEVYARLVTGGAGLQYPEFQPTTHILASKRPDEMRHYGGWFATMDWGYTRGTYGLHAVDPDGRLELVDEFYDGFTALHAKQAAWDILEATKHWPAPQFIHGDVQMFQRIGTAVTLAEEFQAGIDAWVSTHRRPTRPVLIEAKHPPGSRATKVANLHQWLAVGKDANGRAIVDEQGQPEPWAAPHYRIQDRCANTIRVLSTIPKDPKKPDDVDPKFPDDHPHDMTGFAVATRPLPPRPVPTMRHEDQDRGRLPGQPDPRRSPHPTNRAPLSPPWRRPTHVHEVEP